jgi:2-methylcitrate dehydratase PrpD
MSVSEQLATSVVNVRHDDIPDDVRRKAVACILDCVGATLAGSMEPIRVPVTRFVDARGGRTDATVIGTGTKSSIVNAAFANGVFGHVLDFDDTNQIFVGHGSVVVVPAILALAEHLGASGRDVVTAYMVGTEVQWRLGDAFVYSGNHYAKGWHSTCTIGSFGAAAAAGKLLRLDVTQLTHAIGLTASMAAGFQEQFGTHGKAFHAGRANENGVNAALLAQGGFTSATRAIEGPVGFARLVADQYDLEKVEGFGRPWGISDPTFARGINLKKFPVCASGVGAIEGMLELAAEHGIRPDDVATIECGVRPHALNILMYHQPQTGLEAKFSVEYWVAAALLDRAFGLRQTTDEMVRRPAVQDLMRKVTVFGDPEIVFPWSKVKIKVTLKDGRILDKLYYPPRGAADNPMSDAELVEKFNDCAGSAGWSKEKSERAVTMLAELDTLKDVRGLMSLLAAP